MGLPKEIDGEKIEYFFDEGLEVGSVVPKVGKDGKVDYHECTSVIQNVIKDQVLAKLACSQKGQNRASHSLAFLCGDNVYISERDPHALLSAINGYVYVEDNKICVSDTYCVKCDVDFSTGNITFVGNLVVNGNIKQGFSVKVGKSLHVKGAIEPSKIYVEGDVVVGGGIIGDKRSIVKSMGSVKMSYGRNANIMAYGDVISGNSLMFCNVISKGRVEVLGAGRISGGRVEAEKYVKAKVVGAKMATPTMVRVGIDPFLCEKFRVVSKKLRELEKKVEELERSLKYIMSKKDVPSEIKDAVFSETAEVLKARLSILMNQRNLYRKRYNMLKQSLMRCVESGDREKCVFIVEELVYTGVTVEILGEKYCITDNIAGGIFKKSDNGIKIESLK